MGSPQSMRFLWRRRVSNFSLENTILNLLIIFIIVEMWSFIVFLTSLATVKSLNINDGQYYDMPQLYHLDDWEKCVAKEQVFCVGTFRVLPHGDDQLFTDLQNYSSNKHHYDHTLIHRGYCLDSTCANIEGSTPGARFESCVSNLTSISHGLTASLEDLKYCGLKESRAVDWWDLGVLGLLGVIVLMNGIGTTYDIFKSSDGKRSKLLLVWSLRVNWKRLTADYGDGNPRLSALKPLHGIKVASTFMVLFSHSWFLYHTIYVNNPQFFEKESYKFHSVAVQNGTLVVQIFFMISSFLFAYNLLLSKRSGLAMMPKALVHRLIRLTPIYLLIIGVATSWWSHAGEGPLWAPLVEAEVAACRHKWWSHALYVNNLLSTNVNCLIHTWYMAVDTQLYLVSAIVTCLLARNPRSAVRWLLLMVVAAMVLDFAIVYHWRYKPMVAIMFPEIMRTVFSEEPSFTWQYKAPWHSLPAALMGVLVAFVHHQQQEFKDRTEENWLVKLLYHASLVGLPAWVAAGYWMREVTDPLCLSLYATLYRPVFAACSAVAMYGFFNKLDSLWCKFLSWHGWEVLGRMSLSIYLVHWFFSLSLFATRKYPSEASLWYISEHWLLTMCLSYLAAVPLCLLVELPGSKFLEGLISGFS